MKKIVYQDKIYGKEKIKELVLIELLETTPIRRLKGISQYGIPDDYYNIRIKNYSRFDHSVGVMIILRRLGASLEEQLAGLIHDVSHLAFSHVADWVFSDGEKGDEDFHHTLQEKFVKKTEIAQIIKKHGFSIERLLNEENFPLLESEIPDLCADRIDYALREIVSWLKPEEVKKNSNYINNLSNFNNEIVFTDSEVALDFARNFL